MKLSKYSGMVLSCAVLAGAAMAQMPASHQMPAAPVTAAGPSGPAGEVLRNYTAVKGNILKSAEKMPDDGYQFKPKPDIRTYARIINHVIEAQTRSCGIFNGVAPADLPKIPSDTATKAEIVAALKVSFESCDKAYAALTEANMTEMLTAGPAKRSRIGILWGNASHDNEQYAQLALYLRLKDIAPPSSEK